MRTIKIFSMQFQRSLEQEIIHLCKILNTELRSGFDKKLQNYGLTGQQGRILFFINIREEMETITHQNDIETHFGLSKSTVSGLVSRLENKGFIVKKPSLPYVELKVTEKGKDLIETFKKGRTMITKKLFKDIPTEDRKKLHDVLEKLVNNVKEEEK